MLIMKTVLTRIKSELLLNHKRALCKGFYNTLHGSFFYLKTLYYIVIMVNRAIEYSDALLFQIKYYIFSFFSASSIFSRRIFRMEYIIDTNTTKNTLNILMSILFTGR